MDAWSDEKEDWRKLTAVEGGKMEQDAGYPTVAGRHTHGGCTVKIS